MQRRDSFCAGIFLVARLFMCLEFGQAQTQIESYQHQLVEDLLKNYDKNVRPVKNVSTPSLVMFGISLTQIIELNMKEQHITVSMWRKTTWIDEFLKWNISKYDGIEYTYIPVSQIWVPDVTLYNNIKGYLVDDVYAVVSYNGSVTYRLNDVTQTSCSLNLLYFPFDRQECTLNFGSWAYNVRHINVFPGVEANDTSSYVKNGEWVLISLLFEYHLENYSRFEEPYSMLSFTITIQRMPQYYIFNLLVPSVILSMLMLVTFCLPPESGEKIALCITNLLALVVFQQLVMQMMPPSSGTTPYIAYYFLAMITITAISCGMTVWVLSLFHHNIHPRPVPGWARQLVFGCLQPCLCMGTGNCGKRCRGGQGQDDSEQTYTVQLVDANAQTGDPVHNASTGCNTEKASLDEKISRPVYSRPKISVHTAKNIESLLNHVKYFSTKLDEKEELNAIISEWRELARIVDRLLCFIFSITLLFIVIFLIAKIA